ncbi:Cas9 inhibitor AcrIIA9 family protein [Listeria monocytogenes]
MTIVEKLSIREQALNKMLMEMNEKHSGAEDVIHNWLCTQEEEVIFEGIMKDDRSIKGAVKYCSSRASKHQAEGVAMIDDKTVFSWVKKYFISEKVTKSSVKATVKATATKPEKTKVKAKKKPKKTTAQEGYEQLDLLDFL